MKWKRNSIRQVQQSLLLAHALVEQLPFWLEKSFRMSSMELGHPVACSDLRLCRPTSTMILLSNCSIMAVQTVLICCQRHSNNSKRLLTLKKPKNCRNYSEYPRKHQWILANRKTFNTFTIYYSNTSHSSYTLWSEFSQSNILVRWFDPIVCALSLKCFLSGIHLASKIAWRPSESSARVWVMVKMHWNRFRIGFLIYIAVKCNQISATRNIWMHSKWYSHCKPLNSFIVLNSAQIGL